MTLVKRLYDQDHAHHAFVRAPIGENVQVAERRWVFQPSDGVRCYVHGVRVPHWLYVALGAAYRQGQDQTGDE